MEVIIQPGSIYMSTTVESPLQGIYRALQNIGDEVVLIQIPGAHRLHKKSNKKNYYVRGFLKRQAKVIESLIRAKQLVKTTLSLPPFWNLSDDQIREEYPSPTGGESYPIITRDEKWKMISPILPDDTSNPGIDLTMLYIAARERATKEKINVGVMFDALNTYFAYGCIKNALIPNKYNCGAPGKPRTVKTKGKKLGRRNAAAAAGNNALQGLVLSSDDIQNLQDGWNLLVRPGVTVSDAYLAMCAIFYAKEIVLKNDILTPVLLEAHLRPTEREFRYHGPKSQEDAAARRLLGEGEWSKNYRELCGTARSGVFAIGQVCGVDVSPIDLNCCAISDRLKPIGVGRCVLVKEVFSDLYLGWHNAIGGVGVDAANLAILRSAEDKTPILKKYNMDHLPADDFPSIFSSKYISDNGELRCLRGIGAVVENLGSRIEFIRSNRPDLNSSVESGHHSKHRGLDHKIVGTTRGRQNKRGEKPAIANATLSQYDYNRQLIRWIHWKNTKELVPHLLTLEMRRDNVHPTRIEMYRWSVKNGYISGKPIDPSYLKAHLLPTFTASIRRNGLILHRPNNGDAVELLHGARFSDPYLAISGLIREAMNGGKNHIEVKADPDDLSKVYLIDAQGIHTIKNVTDDFLLAQEGCIADLCAIQDTEKLRRVESATQTDQDKSEAAAFRVEEEEKAKQEKIKAKANAANAPKPKSDKATVRGNQQAERQAQLEESIRRSSNIPENKLQSGHTDKDDTSEKHESSCSPSPSAALDLVEKMQRELFQFHQSREN